MGKSRKGTSIITAKLPPANKTIPVKGMQVALKIVPRPITLGLEEFVHNTTEEVPLPIFDQWARYAVEILSAEFKYSGGLTAHGTLIGDAREALIQMVLSRILPGVYEVGRGQIVDSQGNRSKQIDIIIARRDSPALSLLSGAKVYLVESVLATIEVKSSLEGGEKGTLWEALDNCASVADLFPQVDADTLAPLKEQLIPKAGEDEALMRLKQHRYTLNGRPATYIFGFTGYKESSRHLAEAIQTWWEARQPLRRREEKQPLVLCHLPAVVASEGCFAFRNGGPYEIPYDPAKPVCLAYSGSDETPLRMLIAHLLVTLHSKTPWMPDLSGLRMEPRVYIEQMAPLTYDHSLLCDRPAPVNPTSTILEE